MPYCTEGDVRRYTNITEEDVASDVVLEMIISAEDLINNLTGTIFSQGTVSSEYHDDNGTGIIDVKYIPIISITSVEYTDDFGSTYSTLENSNYYNKEWAIKIKKNSDIALIDGSEHRFRVSYEYGHSSCPILVKNICIMLAGVLTACYFKDDPKNNREYVKLGDSTVKYENINKKKEDVIRASEELLLPYTYTEIRVVR